MTQSLMDSLLSVFRAFDASGTGCIKREALEGVIKSVSSTTYTAAQMDALLSSFDEVGDGFVRYEAFLLWLMRCGSPCHVPSNKRPAKENAVAQSMLRRCVSMVEPSAEEEKALEAAVATVLCMVERYPSSKKIAATLRKNNLVVKKPLSDCELELQMALAALRASSLYNTTKHDLKQRHADMNEVLSRSRPLEALDERNAEIVRKRDAMASGWKEKQIVAKTLEQNAIHRFDDLRVSLQEKLVPDILRDLERYDAATAELDPDKLRELMNAGKPFFERTAKRLKDNFGGTLRQQSLTGQDGSEEYGMYDSVALLNRLYSEAETNSWYSDSLAKQIASESGGSFKRGPLKSKERMIEKTEEDNEGDYLLLCDIDRNSIAFGDLDELSNGLLAIDRLDREGSVEVVRIKVRIDPSFPARSKSGGYRDILMNYRLPNSPNPMHISELQLHLKKFLAIKGDGGHATYEMVRMLHIFDPDLTFHAGRFDQSVAAKVRLGIIVNLNIQGWEPDWQLLCSSLSADTSRVERLNLQGCGGDNAQMAGVIEALATGPTRGRLTKLSLAGDDVNKAKYTSLPWQTLCCCTELQELDLENGVLQGPLPDIFKLTSLQQLELSLNPLNIPFPVGILKLTKLSILMLRDCKLFGDIPADFSQFCSDIQVLALARNDLEPHSVVFALCGLQKLKYADVRGIAVGGHRDEIECGVPAGCRIEMDVKSDDPVMPKPS